MIVLAYLYFTFILALAVYGLHRSVMILRLIRSPYKTPPLPHMYEWPRVCVQLPLFNEPKVCERLLRAASALEYPGEKLEIQVLDDSSDETIELVDHLVAELQGEGVCIEVIRRENRKGFKAGALRYGLTRTDAELVAIFDADFIPPQDFLLRTVPYFREVDLGFVQSRWEHLNRGQSLLTRAQAVLLDGHFAVEHASRFAGGVFFNFNGTAGIWRVSAIEQAGGWQGDTITEDLDLSYRAQLLGWKSIYLRDYASPGELPETIAAFKSQQYRWTKGTAQVFKKLGLSILNSPISWRHKLEALFHLSAHFCYLFGFFVALLIVPVSSWRSQVYFAIGSWFELLVFIFTLGSMVSFYLFSQFELGVARGSSDSRSYLQIAFEVLVAIALGVGLSAHCAIACIAGLGSSVGEFVRTPKTGRRGAERWHRFHFSLDILRQHSKELFMLCYLVLGLAYLLLEQNVLTIPFVFLLFSGYGMILLSALRREHVA